MVFTGRVLLCYSQLNKYRKLYVTGLGGASGPQLAMTRRYGARRQAVVGHGPDVVRHHRGSGTVLSHQPSTAPTREGNVIANTPLPPRGHWCLTLEIGDGNCAGRRGQCGGAS